MISLIVISITAAAGAGAMIRSHFKTVHESVVLVKQHEPAYKTNRHNTIVHTIMENLKK